MRYGVLSDIHGNLAALESALAALRREGVDGFLCTGDLVGYGPRPNECVETVAEIGAVCVAGNHELLALDRLPEPDLSPLARETLPWTRDALRDDVRCFLSQLPLRAETPESIVLTHASLRDPQQRVIQPAAAREQLGLLASEHPGARFLLVGHTHRPWVYGAAQGPRQLGPEGWVDLRRDGSYLLNPGSVGQSRSLELRARARFMLLDLEARRAKFFAIDYDVQRCREELRRAGLPMHAYHRRPPILPMSVHRARGVIGRKVIRALDRLRAA